MRVSSTTQAPPDTAADTIAVGVFEGEPIAHDVDGVLQGLVDAGEARAALRKIAVAHAGGRRYVLAGLGRRDDFDAQRARLPGAAAGAPRCWPAAAGVTTSTPSAPGSRPPLWPAAPRSSAPGSSAGSCPTTSRR